MTVAHIIASLSSSRRGNLLPAAEFTLIGDLDDRLTRCRRQTYTSKEVEEEEEEGEEEEAKETRRKESKSSKKGAANDRAHK